MCLSVCSTQDSCVGSVVTDTLNSICSTEGKCEESRGHWGFSVERKFPCDQQERTKDTELPCHITLPFLFRERPFLGSTHFTRERFILTCLGTRDSYTGNTYLILVVLLEGRTFFLVFGYPWRSASISVIQKLSISVLTTVPTIYR